MSNNAKKIYAFNFFWMFLLIQPVIVPYFQRHGLSLTQVFMVFTIFSTTLCLFEIPTGYFSDLVGRKKTLILASLLKGLGGVSLALAHDVLGFSAAYFLIGLANSLYSGADISLLYETREVLDTDGKKPRNFFGNRVFFSQLGVMLAAIFGAKVAAISFETAIVLNSVFAWIPLAIAFFLTEPPKARLRTSHMANFRTIGTTLSKSSFLFKWVSLSSIFYGAAPVLATVAFQGFWESQGIELEAFGLIAVVYGLTGAVSGTLAGNAEHRLGRSALILFIGVAPVLGFFGCGLFSVATAVAFGLLLEICRGFSQALFNELLNQELSSNLRATLNSIVALGNRLVVAILGPILGVLADRYGFSSMFRSLAVFYLGVFVIAIVRRPQI